MFSVLLCLSLVTCSVFAADPATIYNQAHSYCASPYRSLDRHAITLFESIKSDACFGPSARFNIGLLQPALEDQKNAFMPLIATDCFQTCEPNITYDLQVRACDILFNRYIQAGNTDAALICALNRLIVEEHFDSLTSDIFSPMCLDAINYLVQAAFESEASTAIHRYLDPLDDREKKDFLIKVFSSAHLQNNPRGTFLLALSEISERNMENGKLIFEQLFEAAPQGAISMLCSCAKSGTLPAQKLAVELAGQDRYVEHKIDLLEAAAQGNYAPAHYALGRHFKTIMNYNLTTSAAQEMKHKAIKHLSAAAQAGNPKAILDLATMPKTYLSMIESLKKLAYDTKFPLVAVAQQQLATVLCSWAEHCIKEGVHIDRQPPVESLKQAIVLYKRVISSAKKPLEELLFNAYAHAVLTLIEQHKKAKDKKELLNNARGFLKKCSILHPKSRDALHLLAQDGKYSSPSPILKTKIQRIVSKPAEPSKSEENNTIRLIQLSDRYINQILERIKTTEDVAQQKLLYTMAEKYLSSLPECAITLRLKGIIEYNKKEYAAAKNTFEQVIQLDPQDLPSAYLLSLSCEKLIETDK